MELGVFIENVFAQLRNKLQFCQQFVNLEFGYVVPLFPRVLSLL